MTVIETHDLRKHFGKVTALDGLDLCVDEGEVHGFLGPNGAGKSTTIRVLLGLIKADSGAATLLGGDPWADAERLHHQVAYVPGDVSLWPNLSGGETIDLLARLRGADTRADGYRARRADLLEQFQLNPSAKIRTYSKGNRQKVALVAAFAVPAELYLLDEPTSGLDPLMANVFARQIDAVSRAGSTVLLSSHILSEVQRLAERVSIVRAGRIVERGTLADIRHLSRTQVSFDGEGVSDADLAALTALPSVHDLTPDSGRVSFTTDSDAVDAVLPALAGLRVQGLTIEPPSLEELFLRHYGDASDPAAPTEPTAPSTSTAASGPTPGSAG